MATQKPDSEKNITIPRSLLEELLTATNATINYLEEERQDLKNGRCTLPEVLKDHKLRRTLRLLEGIRDNQTTLRHTLSK